MGNKLSSAISVEAHSASESVIKEFKRLGSDIKIVKFKKKSFNVNEDSSKKVKAEKVVDPDSKKKVELNVNDRKKTSNLKSENKKKPSKTKKKTK